MRVVATRHYCVVLVQRRENSGAVAHGIDCIACVVCRVITRITDDRVGVGIGSERVVVRMDRSIGRIACAVGVVCVGRIVSVTLVTRARTYRAGCSGRRRRLAVNFHVLSQRTRVSVALVTAPDLAVVRLVTGVHM